MTGYFELSIEKLLPLIESAVRILLVLAAALVTVKVVNRSVPKIRSEIVKMMLRHAEGTPGELEKRAATLGGILRKTIAVVVWTVAVITSLKLAGYDVGPILAGAGVIGLAVGFVTRFPVSSCCSKTRFA